MTTAMNKAYIMKRLEADFPDLYHQVKSKRLSTYKAAKQAGLVYDYIRIRREAQHVAPKLAEHFTCDELLVIVKDLNNLLWGEDEIT